MSRSMNYGLKKRPDYDEIQDYLNNKQPKLKYPDRLATFIRRTNQMSNLLDGEGYSLFDLEMQQQKNMKTEQAKEIVLLKTGVDVGSVVGSSPPIIKGWVFTPIIKGWVFNI